MIIHSNECAQTNFKIKATAIINNVDVEKGDIIELHFHIFNSLSEVQCHLKSYTTTRLRNKLCQYGERSISNNKKNDSTNDRDRSCLTFGVYRFFLIFQFVIFTFFSFLSFFLRRAQHFHVIHKRLREESTL